MCEVGDGNPPLVHTLLFSWYGEALIMPVKQAHYLTTLHITYGMQTTPVRSLHLSSEKGSIRSQFIYSQHFIKKSINILIAFDSYTQLGPNMLNWSGRF